MSLCFSLIQINCVNIKGRDGTNIDFIYLNLAIFIVISFFKLPYSAPNMIGFEAQSGSVLCEFEIVQ
jgi:hypothetical protein